MDIPACPKCQNTIIVKSGVIKDRQRYLCKSCNYFFTVNKLGKKIEDVLIKYEVPFEVTDQSSLLLNNPDLFSEEFLEKLDSYLNQHLTVDDVLDNIIEVGINNISIFEKYFLENNKENKD